MDEQHPIRGTGSQVKASKDLVGKIVGVNDTPEWMIIDRIGSLVMLGLTPHADLSRWSRLQGMVVDTDVGVVVCPGVGEVFRTTSDSLNVSKNTVKFIDHSGSEYSIDSDTPLRFLLTRDGPTLRIFKHRKRVYVSTFTKISSAETLFGIPGMKLEELIQGAGSPDLGELFGEFDSSPVVYFATMFSKRLQLVGKSTEEDSLLLMGYTLAYLVGEGEGGSPNTVNSHDITLIAPLDKIIPMAVPLKVQKMGTVGIAPHEVTEKFAKYPEGSLVNAKKFLTSGFGAAKYSDPRLSRGEGVLVLGVKDSQTFLVQVTSAARDWRIAVRGVVEDFVCQAFKAPAVVEQMFNLSTAVTFKRTRNGESINDEDIFARKFPLFVPLTAEQRDSYTEGEFLISEDPTLVRDGKARLSIVHQALIEATSPYYSKAAVGALEVFVKIRDDIVSAIQRMNDNAWDYGPEYSIPAARNIINRARERARRDLEQNLSPGGGEGLPFTYDIMVVKNIRRLVFSERGDILYTLGYIIL